VIKASRIEARAKKARLSAFVSDEEAESDEGATSVASFGGRLNKFKKSPRKG
jgi:hypothetical protein